MKQRQRSKKVFITALILLILSTGILSFCLKIYKMGALAYIGQTVGGMEGVYDKVKNFRFYGLVGTIFELISVVLLTAVSAKMISFRSKEQAGEGE